MTFVTIEGLDGAGKDTALDAVRDEWSGATITAEPSDMWTGKQVRRVLKDEGSHPLIDFYLFMADRVNHIESKVKPIDREGGLVVSGRYADSTRVYQPVALTNMDVFESQWKAKSFIEQVMGPWDYEPDVTLYLDISVDTALERADKEEKYETRQFLEKVHDNYEALVDANEDRFVRIDAEQSQEDVRDDVVEEISHRHN